MYTDNLILVIMAIMIVVIAALWRQTAVASARLHLFEARNELFIYWADTGLPFNTPAYCRLRKMINNSIRFANVTTPARFVFFYIWYEYINKKSAGLLKDIPLMVEESRKALAVDYPEIAERLMHYQNDHSSTAIRLYIFGSPSGLLFGAGIFIKNIFGKRKFLNVKKTLHETEKMTLRVQARTTQCFDLGKRGLVGTC